MLKNIALHPELAEIELGHVQLEYTKHAILRAEEKNIILANHIVVSKGMVQELDTEERKMVVRLPYNDANDITYVLVKGIWCLRAKTVWLNNIYDRHQTLNMDRFKL